VDLRSYRPRSSAQLSPRSLGVIAFFAAILFSVGWTSQEAFIGKAPTEAFQAKNEAPASTSQKIESHTGEAAVTLSDALQKLKSAALENPENKEAWLIYVTALGEEVKADPSKRDLVFEALEALRRIIDIDPKDKDALLMMAEISFQQQAFSKSAEFYKKYLELAPEDLDIRARYASSLTFVKDFPKAIQELEQIIAKQSDHFQALAYLSVAYSEKGDLNQARLYGERALKAAPNDEARTRLSKFIDSIGKSSTPNRGTIPQSSTTDGSAKLPPAGEAIVSLIKNNPVAGPKVIGGEMKGDDTVQINLNDFPMDSMPPFVRDKFVSKIREQAFSNNSEIKKIVLFDQVSGKVLQVIQPQQ
jgi:tetratricopeptide (TPR) repeat protein